MAVIKRPYPRKGTLSRRPPLSWPNDTVIGRRRSHLGLLRQATLNSQQRRMSELSASSKNDVSKPIQQPALQPQAPRFSGNSKYKAHKRTLHSTPHPNTPKYLGKLKKRLASHGPQHRKKSKLSTNSPTAENEDAKSQKNIHISKSFLTTLLSHRRHLKLTPPSPQLQYPPKA